MNERKEHGTRNLTMKNLSKEDQPREKLIAKGKKELSKAELLAILIGSGTVGLSAVELAKVLLNSVDNNLAKLSRQGVKELTKNFKGMGDAKAVTIIAALELGYRMLNDNFSQDEIFINDSRDLFQCTVSDIINLDYEEFWAVYMNVKHKVIFRQRISQGGLIETPVDIRKIFYTAIEKNAIFIAVAHNHPSGSIKPSRSDIELTQKIKEAGSILNIKLTDHIIVGMDSQNKPQYYSFHDNGMI